MISVLTLMHFSAAAANLAICIVGFALSRSIFVIYWAIAFFIVGSVNLDYLAGEQSREIVERANVYSLFFNFIFLVFQSMFFKWEIKTLQISELVVDRVSVISVILSITGVIGFILSVPGGLINLMTLDWQEVSVSRTGVYIIIANLAMFATISSSSIVVPCLIRKKHKLRMIVVFLANLIVLVMSKKKAYILPCLFNFVVYIAISRKRWITWRAVRVLLLFAVGLVGFYLFTASVRYSGSINDLLSASNAEIADTLILAASASVEAELTKTYYSILEYFQTNTLLHGAAFSRLALYPLSFVLDVDVPENPMYMYGEITHSGSQSLLQPSNHPTIYGDAYANFGELGFLGGAFYAILLGLIWLFALSQSGFGRFSTISACCYGIPLIMRGSVFYGLYGMIFTMLLGIVISFFTREGYRKQLSLDTRHCPQKK